MQRRRTPIRRSLLLLCGAAGCAGAPGRVEPSRIDDRVARASFAHPDPEPIPAAAIAIAPPPPTGPQPVEAYIARALAENRTVQAAAHNVEALRFRIPQVTALDDPYLSNTIYPIPSVAPQYSLMGYNPYNFTLAQQFPWFGTLKVRGEVASRDVKVAVAELAAAQLDAVVGVRRAYFDLHAAERVGAILAESRTILEDFQAIAESRLASGGTQQDVIRAGTLLSELDRSIAANVQDAASARSSLARLIHASPEDDLRTLPELAIATVPAEIDRLYRLALIARPELRGRLEAVARDAGAVELARKRARPNVSLGLNYMLMEQTNASSPTAGGMPNVGLFVGFNLPVNQKKYRAGVCEAQQRMAADAKLYEAQQDETNSEIKDAFTQAKVQRDVLALLRDSILPRARETLDLAKTDYKANNVDIATILSAQREVLQVEIQSAQVEAELAKAVSSLERAVGDQVSARTLEPSPEPEAVPIPAASEPGPFRPEPIAPGSGSATSPDSSRGPIRATGSAGRGTGTRSSGA